MAGRSIRFDNDCELAAEKLGGYEAIDDSLYAYYGALQLEPHGFGKVDTAFGSTRYVHTKPIGDIPELIWYFLIESNGDILIVHVEKYHE
jgi:hypothetical protein